MKVTINRADCIQSSPLPRANLKSQNTLRVPGLAFTRPKLDCNPFPKRRKDVKIDCSQNSALTVENGEPKRSFLGSACSTASRRSLRPKPNRSKTIGSALIPGSRRLISKREVKQAFDEIFKEELEMDKKQRKLDYFYSAYNTNPAGECMKFENSFSFDHTNKCEEKFLRRANLKWERISSNILETNEKDFRSFLKTVNKNMYDDLVKMGQKFCNKIILPKVRGQAKDVEAPKAHQHLEKGIKMLKKVIKEKLINKKKQLAAPQVMSPPPMDSEAGRNELLTPLVYISRGSNKNTERSETRTFQGTQLESSTQASCKTIQKLKFSDFTKVVDPMNIDKTYKNMVQKQFYKSVDRKPTRRRKSLFEFLHSEKQIRGVSTCQSGRCESQFKRQKAKRKFKTTKSIGFKTSHKNTARRSLRFAKPNSIKFISTKKVKKPQFEHFKESELTKPTSRESESSVSLDSVHNLE